MKNIFNIGEFLINETNKNYNALISEMKTIMDKYKDGKVIARKGKHPNFYSIEFIFPHISRGEITSISGVNTMSGQILENAEKDAKILANGLQELFEKYIDLEDSSVEVGNNSVTLFMVSDEFIDNEIFNKTIKIINK